MSQSISQDIYDKFEYVKMTFKEEIHGQPEEHILFCKRHFNGYLFTIYNVYHVDCEDINPFYDTKTIFKIADCVDDNVFQNLLKIIKKYDDSIDIPISLIIRHNLLYKSYNKRFFGYNTRIEYISESEFIQACLEGF